MKKARTHNSGLAFIMILSIGCRTASKTAQMKVIGEDNRDAVALSYLIRDYMRKTDNNNFSLSDIIKYDTSGRVTNNFSRLEVANWPNVWRGGYVVYFKFSDNRNKESVKLKESSRKEFRGKLKRKIILGGMKNRFPKNLTEKYIFIFLKEITTL